jgi:D-arginine dehydrogenase
VARTSDILVIGGGIAGLSAAAELSKQVRVTVLEAEEHVGFHSSGRSATMVHYFLGDRIVRALTLASRPFFDSPPAGFDETPLGRRMPVLIHAREEERAELETLHAEVSRFANIEWLDAKAVQALCPLLKPDAAYGLVDETGTRLDPHALLQANLRALRANGGALVTGARVSGIARQDGEWRIVTERREEFVAPIIVDAAGSWADQVAKLAGVAPIGLQPKRRTIITFDAPPGTDLDALPFTKTVRDELYFAPESGRLFASPMDEVPSEPCDAQPDELDVALAAYRVEERTVVNVDRIHSRWAGLRTFTRDRRPAAGLAYEVDGFFWLAGQGGFGLQTSPAMAAITAALVFGTSWPISDVAEEELSPDRFFRSAT